MEIGPPNSILRISIRGRKYYRYAPATNFSSLAVGLPLNDIPRVVGRKCRTSSRMNSSRENIHERREFRRSLELGLRISTLHT